MNVKRILNLIRIKNNFDWKESGFNVIFPEVNAKNSNSSDKANVGNKDTNQSAFVKSAAFLFVEN